MVRPKQYVLEPTKKRNSTIAKKKDIQANTKAIEKAREAILNNEVAKEQAKLKKRVQNSKFKSIFDASFTASSVQQIINSVSRELYRAMGIRNANESLKVSIMVQAEVSRVFTELGGVANVEYAKFYYNLKEVINSESDIHVGYYRSIDNRTSQLQCIW